METADQAQSPEIVPLPAWTLVTSHGLVLLYVAMKPDATVREIASQLELTDRRVADIIRDLAKEGFMRVQRDGRRNHYTLNPDASFRHPLVANVPFNDFVSIFHKIASPPPLKPDQEPDV